MMVLCNLRSIVFRLILKGPLAGVSWDKGHETTIYMLNSFACFNVCLIIRLRHPVFIGFLRSNILFLVVSGWEDISVEAVQRVC